MCLAPLGWRLEPPPRPREHGRRGVGGAPFRPRRPALTLAPPAVGVEVVVEQRHVGDRLARALLEVEREPGEG